MSEYAVAKYLRLSSEDTDLHGSTDKLESNSISNQRNLLDSYINLRVKSFIARKECVQGIYERDTILKKIVAIPAKKQFVMIDLMS